MTVKSLLRTSIILICFVAGISACKESKPKDIIPKDKMTNILLDVYIGEGKISALSVKRDSSLAIFDVYEGRIFEKHQVERETYKKSLSYYYDHPMELEEIYNSVMDSLNVKEQKLKEAKDKSKKGNKKDDKKSKGDDK